MTNKQAAIKAVSLYAMGSRDFVDFLEALAEEESVEVLNLLFEMLTEPNPSPKHDKALNGMMAPFVDKARKKLVSKKYQIDNCQVCLGSNGGVKGNENVIDDVVMCDYCSVIHIAKKK